MWVGLPNFDSSPCEAAACKASLTSVMLPTFVIGLREGLEAALIVAIIGAYLRKQGRTDALRSMWIGVVSAVILCVGVGAALQILHHDLPEGGQQILEATVAIVAVVMVSLMIVWMRRHGRHLASELRSNAAEALAEGSMFALVVMAFLAVVREGFETSVFLLAAFQASGNGAASGLGALFGVLAAVAIGWGIFSGGMKLNLGKFFQITSAVLVVVAAGLVAKAVGTGEEANVITVLQGQAVNLSSIIRPDTVESSLFSGVLGLEVKPTVAELTAWLIYALPMLTFVLWPSGRTPRPGRRIATAEASAEA